MAGRTLADLGPQFDRPVPPGGYAWWHVDARSDDGTRGLTITAFVGSAFSPYYALARRRGGGGADPLNHCAVNVALYGPGGRWSMTERGRSRVSREPDRLVVGPSDLGWAGETLTVRFDEICAPIPKRVRGIVRVTPLAILDQAYEIDGEGRHEWRPIAPLARVEAICENPRLEWRGDGYFDCNHGAEPLEAGLRAWRSSRAKTRDGVAILHDVERVDSKALSIALSVDAAGTASRFEAPPETALPRPLWRMTRPVRCDADATPRVLSTLQDTPFYARTRLATRLGGEDVEMMHQSLSLDRFRMPAVQGTLPFRMPRRA